MTQRLGVLFFKATFVLMLSGFCVVFASNATTHADGTNGPFVSEKIRDEVVDHMQLTYTLGGCTPGKLGQENAEFPNANIPQGDTAFASIPQLRDQKVLDQGILGATSTRGDMFPNEILPCDNGNSYGYRWPFVNFGRGNLVEFFCSLPGVYHSISGGQGRTVGGGSTKAACEAGPKLNDGVFVLAKNHSLKDEAKAEFSKSKRGRIAAAELTPAKKYIQYWLTFENSCKAPLTSPYPASGDPAANSGSIFKIPVVNQNGELVNYIANSGKTPMDGHKIYLDATTPFDTNITCGDLAIGMRKFAPAYAAYMKGPGKNDTGVSGTGIPEVALGEEDSGTGGETSCAVDGIGWIICPVVTFLGKITDQMYKVLADQLLEVRAGAIFDQNGGTFKAWSSMRNIANVAFVVAFLFIIYSQLTGVGLSNYGIKKMLPKIVISAILVNISFWLCAVAVDLSNILGHSLKALFDSTSGTLTFEVDDGSGLKTGNGWGGVAVIILASAGLAIAGLSVLLPALVVVAFAVVTVVGVLAMRQALIILLIVISPLAFVAYLLPNTEDWFKKWFSLFKTLLIMFPIISLIFGASAMASVIVMGSANGNVVIAVVGALISIVPLFITPIVMKSAGGVLNRLGGIVNNPNKGPFDRMRKGADKVRENSQVSRGLRAMDPNKRSFPGRRSFINQRNKRNAINSGRAEQFSDLQKEDMAKLAVENDGFAQKVAGNRSELYQQKQETYLASVNPDKLKLDLDKSQVSNMVGELTLSVKDPANKIAEMKKVLEDESKAGGNVIKARAAQEILMNSGNKGAGALREALNTVDRNSEAGIDLRKDIASSNLKGKAADVYQWSVDGAGRSLDAVSKDAGTWSGLADAQLAGQVEGAMHAAVASGGVSQAKAQSTLSSRGSENIGEKEAKVLSDHASGPGPSP